MIKCQNDHNIALTLLELHQANKVVCPTCEIVVKDRESQDGIYELKYADIKTGDRIPDGLLQNPAKLLQWFCSSLSDYEAETIGKIASENHIRISSDATKNLIEEQIPLLRNKYTSVGGDTIEKLRQAIFNIEKELGLVKGQYAEVKARLDKLEPTHVLSDKNKKRIVDVLVGNKSVGKVELKNDITDPVVRGEITFDSEGIRKRLTADDVAAAFKKGYIKDHPAFDLPTQSTEMPISAAKLTDQLELSLNPDGTIKPETLTKLYGEMTTITNKASRRSVRDPSAEVPICEEEGTFEKPSNGQTCKRCKEHYGYVEQANQNDGTFLCYACRNNC